jgi:hypothetical protein
MPTYLGIQFSSASLCQATTDLKVKSARDAFVDLNGTTNYFKVAYGTKAPNNTKSGAWAAHHIIPKQLVA